MCCRKSMCKICPRIKISQAVTWNGTSVVINLPAGCYNDREQYCIVIAQSIPSAATVNAPVVVTIGSGTQQYPLNLCDCSQATVCNIRTRTRYAVRVATSSTSGAFKLLGRCHCAPTNNLESINGTAPTGGTT